MTDQSRMTKNQSHKRSHLSGLLHRIRRAVWRRWGSKTYLVYFKHPGQGGPRAEASGDRVVFRIATEEDIPWMVPYLGEWARWCFGGQDVSPETVLREQFDGGDITVIGIENKPEGELVYILSICYDEFALRLMGDAFTAGSDVSVRRAWVVPSHRRQGIGASGEIFADAEVVRRGLEGIWGFVQSENGVSERLQERLGYEYRGKVRIVTRLGRRYAGVCLEPGGVWQNQRVPHSLSHL